MVDDNNAVVEDSLLNMSDEDFLKAPVPVASEETDTVIESTVNENNVSTSNAETDDDEVDESKSIAQVPGEAEGTSKTETVKPVDKQAVEAVVEQVPVDIDYKTEYERLLKPFKANGRDVEVKSIDEIISLMQMGANYNKKMIGLKPSMKILKLLENNNLLDENKLSFLIDLEKKNPQAINKLIKDSGLDPMDLDADKASEYTPKSYAVDERELDLDTVLDDIQSTPTYNRTLEVVSKQWDGASKQIVAGQPQLLKVINDHMSSGIYDLITAEIDNQRMFGRLDGISDIEAYRKVGDAIQARGGFNNLGSSQTQSASPVIVVPKPKANDEVLKDKRRAASSTPAAANVAPRKDFNPLGLSDEEFAKQAAPRF